MSTENPQNENEAEFSEGSQVISYAVAEPLIEAYKTHPARLYVDNGGAAPQVLKGLRFDRDDIEALLTGDITHLFLMFAVKPGQADYLTLVAGGITDPDHTGGVLNKDLLYDFCDPCPNKCPSNL